jgi:hypothetical protein
MLDDAPGALQQLRSVAAEIEGAKIGGREFEL